MQGRGHGRLGGRGRLCRAGPTCKRAKGGRAYTVSVKDRMGRAGLAGLGCSVHLFFPLFFLSFFSFWFLKSFVSFA
jgi:hypothetical protein